MVNNDFIITLVAALEEMKSKKQINSDIKKLESQVRKINLVASLLPGELKTQINQMISNMESKLKTIKLHGKFDEKEAVREFNNALKNVSLNDIKMNEHGIKLKALKAYNIVKSTMSKSIPVNLDIKKENLQNQLSAFLSKNSKIKESKVLLDTADELRGLFSKIDDKSSLQYATDRLRLYKSEVTATGFASKSTSERVGNLMNGVIKIGSAFGMANLAIQNFRRSLNTLKENSTIITEISKTSNMSASQLKALNDSSFSVASKYGQTASNYLEGVKEMARSGYEDMSKELGELSVLAQSAGDMTSEMANNYLLATDAAYKYGGSIEKLTVALDGSNIISNKNSTSLTDIADATRVSASYAANAGVEIDQLTAAEATMIATTKRSGSEIGRAFRSILLNLQQVAGEFDGEVIDEESLKKVESRCHSLGVELETLKDGVATLRNPMEVLKELSEVYNSLPDSSADKQGLISDIGGKYHANSLTALLSRWDLYEKMLKQFSQGTGSSLEEAMKTADSWEGKLFQLQNTWDSFVNSITNQDYIKSGISFTDNLIQGFEKLTNTIGAIPVLLTGLNASLTALNKDYGITQIVNPETSKFDIQGNMFGIDFTSIKAQKKHFTEAAEAIEKWNKQLKNSQASINDFGEQIVQNNAQFKAYLQTCSKEAPASLEGYKAYLNSAGVSTDALRLKTVLLNSALTLGVSFLIQAAATGISKLVHSQEELARSTREAAQEYETSSDALKGHIERYKELHTALINAKGNEEETYNIKKQLFELQQQLNEEYGDEYGRLNLVTDAYKDQTDAITKYSNTLANLYLNKNEKGIRQAKRKMEGENHYNLSPIGLSEGTDEGRILKDLAEKYQEQGVRIQSDPEGLFSIHLTADAEDAESTINKFMTDLREQASGSETAFLGTFDILSTELNRVNKIIDNSGKTYKEALMAEITSDSNLSENFNKAEKAVEAYNNAIMKSDNPYTDEDVSKAYNNLQLIKQGIQENEEEWGKYSAVTDKVFDEALTGSYEFYNDIKANSQNLINDIAGLTDTELLSMSNDGQEDSFDKLCASAEKYGLSIQDVIDLLVHLGVVQSNFQNSSSDITPSLSISDTLSKLNTELKPAFDSLKSAYQQIFTIEDGKEIFSIENLDLSALTDLQEKFNDISGFDTFLRTVTNLSSTSDMVHDAFDNLAASFLYSQDTLENLNESTASAVIQQLNLLGVNNSQELVTEALTAKTEALALQKQILATEAAALSHNIDFNIISFLDEAGASEITRQTLFKLIAAEQAFNNQELSTEGKIEKLNELATAYGNTAIQSMTASAMVQMEHNGNFDIDKALADIQGAVNEINGVQIDFKGNSNKSAASKSGKKTADAWLEAYKKELAELEHIHDMEKITDREFYENLRDLNEKYFNDTSEHHEKYLDEYRSNEEKVAKGLKDVWTKYWEDYKSDLDKVSSYAERVLSRQIDSLKDKQDNEIDGYDGEMDAIDDKIKALEEERKTVERNYQGQIDAIQKQIDAYDDEIDKLKEVNEEKNRQLQLEQDIYELERLRNQKTQKEYVEGRGIVYKVDSGAIRDQEQQVENDRLDIEIAGYEKLIKGLEAQQDSLKSKMDDIISSIDTQIERLNDQKDVIQDKIDAVNKGYESQIEALEKYKDKWSEVSEHQSMLEEEAIARQLFGANAETAILEMREGILNDYIGRYQMASDSLAMISEAKLHDINGILAQMQISADTVSLLSGGLQDSFVTFQTTFSEFNSAVNTVDTTNVKESLSTAGTVADSTSGQLENITTKLNELATEVSSFTLPPLNTEQFTASLGTADSATGILGQLRTFTERFRELCASIPMVWNEVMNNISGSGLVSGEDRDYNALFTPLLAAMDNCKFQMDTKLAEYVTAWTDFNMDLGGVIGTGGDSGTSSGGDKKSVKDARKPKGGNKENGDISTDSIVGTIQSGGDMINAVFDDTWVPGFKTMGEQINEICQKVVECVNEMAENTVDACRKAVDAINKANAAKKSSSSSNEKPEKFRGNTYTGKAFARGTLPLKQDVDDALVGELGAEIVTNTETGEYRIVGRNGAEFTDLNKGDVVISHTQTEQILRDNSLDYLLPQFKNVVLSPELMTQYIKPQFKNPLDGYYDVQAKMNMQLGAAQKAHDERPVNITQDISVTLPNVTNETGFNNFKRELLEMKNDAIQRIHMR